MKWLTWLPWRYVISRLARSRGFIDPVAVLSRLHRFAQPSEVTEPVELMRAGLILQARGLINTRAIQHNLDWVWPYWIERQFDPHDPSFVPRAFSITHVNLTHRNWTALGVPDCPQMPLVDPRGLVTPLFDGWSIDAWILPAEGDPLLPSRAARADQRMATGAALAVETRIQHDGCDLQQTADVVWSDQIPTCRLRISGSSAAPAFLAVVLRPANPEGVAFVSDIQTRRDGPGFRVNDEHEVRLDQSPDRICLSHYRHGDVFQDLPDGNQLDEQHVACDVGLASGAALYAIPRDGSRAVEVRVPLTAPAQHEFGPRVSRSTRYARGTNWGDVLPVACRCEVPDPHIRALFENAVRNLILFSPDEVYPGPYTSKRFWFRDAAFILNALLVLRQFDRAGRIVERYPARQQHNGFFRSQEGEWDANGQALWTIDRYRRLTGKPLSSELRTAVARGVTWIGRKRLSDVYAEPHAGLLPAGFSAEHLGPNDYFYWDNFWSVAGLERGAVLLTEVGEVDLAGQAQREARSLRDAIDRSLSSTRGHRDRRGVPASPYRRMDAGAIGSLAGSYPAQVWAPRDPRMLETAEFLLRNCTVHGGFFQDMIHSGINVYLSLHLAEVLLRAGDIRCFDIVQALAGLASPTGNWPEAIHPNTRGGCMGDGQHIWAAAEWVIMLRNLFVREEGEVLVIAGGIPPAWLADGAPLRFGPTATPHGAVTVIIEPDGDEVNVSWEADWHGPAPQLDIALPGCRAERVEAGAASVRVARDSVRPAAESAS